MMIATSRDLPRQIVATTAKVAVACCVGWWLFGDTFWPDRESRRNDSSIRFSHFGTYQDFQLWQTIIADYERAHPSRMVRQEYVLGLSGHYNTKMRQQILSSRLPDVALIQLGPFHELAPHFADLSDWTTTRGASPPATHDLNATGLAAFQYEGVQKGLPVSGGNLQIFGNLDCFKRASLHHGRTITPPSSQWTMEEFRETAELLTCDFDGDGRLDQFGFWLPRWIYYLPFLWSFGAELTNDTLTEWTLTGQRAEEALQFYRDLAVGERVCPRAEEVPQLFQDVGFLTGKVALCINGPWLMPFLDETRMADSYFVAPIPLGGEGRPTRITWDGIVMAPDLPPDQRAMALDFVRFVLSKPVQDRIARTGRALPARTESTNAFNESPENPNRKRFVEALSQSRLQPLLHRFGEIDRAVNKHFRKILDPASTDSIREILLRLTQEPAIASLSHPRPVGSR